MDTIGVDLHKRESQLCILTDDGELIERRIATSRARFTEVLGSRPPAQILLEASTSEWVARHLESFGHTVIVADPGFGADVRDTIEAREDGQARRTHVV
jgi:transposase